MHTISIEDGAYNFLKVLRLTFGTYAKALTALIKELLQLRKENAKLKRELKQKEKLFQKALLAAVSNKPTINVGNLTPPPSLEHRKISSLQEYILPPISESVKNDLQQELLAIFTGEVLKPSDILATTKPIFTTHPLKELTQDYIIPNIRMTSIKNRDTSIRDYAPKPICKI